MKKQGVESDVKEQQQLNSEYYDKSLLLTKYLMESPIPSSELSRNLFLYLDRRALSRFLFLNDLYTKSMHLHGSIFEFGVRYGVNTALFTSLRGIHEPFNHNRLIVAFDTFEGFASINTKVDGQRTKVGDFSVPDRYIEHLQKVLEIHEQLAPIESVRKFNLVKGDVTSSLPQYLKDNPHTIISLAYFDFDIYEPTIRSLEAIEPFLSDGAILGFDEINVPNWPGETKALREWIGDRKMEIMHSNYRAAAGYVTFRR